MSRPSEFLLKKPSLPSLLSSRHITRRTHASDDAASLKSEIFTPSRDTEQDYFGDSVTVDAYHASEGKGKEKEEDPRERLLATLQRSKIARQPSASSVASRAKPLASSSKSHNEPEEQSLSPSLTTTKRKYYILTSAGKPVYASEDEDDEAVTTLVGVIQAIISIFADEGDKIRYINAGQVKISFLLKAPLYFVCVSDWGEPESVLRNHLDYLHLHVVSVVSLSQLQRTFKQHNNFDLRRLLQGTDAIIASLVSRLQTDFSMLMGALEVLKLDSQVREDISKLLVPTTKNRSDVLYVLVIAAGRVVTLIRPKKHSVHPGDLHLLLNTIFASPSLVAPGSESWIPICLPRFNATGFLHALVSFINRDVGLVFVSVDKEAFFEVREWKESVASKLANSAALRPLDHALTHHSYQVGDLSIPGLRHFVYKSRTYVQITSPSWEGEYEDINHRRQLITLYQRIHDQIHIRPPVYGQGRQPVKLVYLRSNNESVLGWITSTFELYIAFAPLLPKNAAVAGAHAVTRWIKNHSSELFLVTAPSL